MTDSAFIVISGVASAGLQITRKPSDIAVVIGSDVILPCTVPQLGSHHLVWQRSRNNQTGELLFDSNMTKILHSNPNKFSIHGQYDLEVKDVQVEDAGIYGCGTANQAQFYTGLLMVVGKFTNHYLL